MVYVFGIFSVFTASFIPFFVISFLIVIHEVGHFLMTLLLGGEVIKIYIYPLGGISKFRFDINISIFKEFLILIAGPVSQMFAYFFLIHVFSDYCELITIYHYGILFFNLLPIYPLDGGKLVNLFFSLFISYRSSLIVSIGLSFVVVLFLSFIGYGIGNITLNFIVMVIFLLYKIVLEYKQINYLYEKFLLERYLKKYNFKNGIIVDRLEKFRRNRRHLVKMDDNYYFEREILEKKYKNY